MNYGGESVYDSEKGNAKEVERKLAISTRILQIQLDEFTYIYIV